MAELSLYLINVNVTVGQSMDAEKGSATGKEFECVELGELGLNKQQKEKAPRRVIHFSNGETMEEYSTDEEDEDAEKEPEKKDLLAPVDASTLTWGPYVWFQMWRAATSTVSACDYLGERMASLFGITSAKYQYAIDEYYRMKKEKEEGDEDDRLSEEAERYFEEQQCQQTEEPMTGQPEGAPPQVTRAPPLVNITNELESDPQAKPNAISIPAIVTST